MPNLVTRSARPRVLARLACGAALCTSGVAAGADDARLTDIGQQLAQVQAQLRQLAEENRSLREHQLQIERQLAQLAGAAAPAAVSGPSPATGVAAPLAAGLRLWGYGEMYYSNPTRDGRKAQADLARALFGLGYSFDERTEFNSEYEVEHAVTSASDVGEFEVEQFYVDRRLSEAVSARGGLFLMPFGFLTEHREPTRFYGVQRNFVETLIIPSTWREGGFNLHGDTTAGFGWNLGLTTGFDLSKWDFAPAFPPYTTALGLANSHIAPLPATHQELALANAHHLSPYAALSYYGIPALLLGGAISSGEAAAPGDPRGQVGGGRRGWAPAQCAPS